MNITNIEAIPEAMHDKARAALATTFGTAPVNLMMPITGGASGASLFRLQVGGHDYVLRLEGVRNAFRNPHQYTCMRIASEAGIAPPLRHADDANGVVIMDFVPQRQLSEYPGGPAGVAAALGALARRYRTPNRSRCWATTAISLPVCWRVSARCAHRDCSMLMRKVLRA